ncbi:coiled-coil domain-containing protein 189 [Fundulus heteroclitus]|uniref:coiled-coil domain-containing protein 189 n=1 Tax=Fundulus heteroclitus TaxID=8078 RepID=UPI00165CEA8B|nr:coiled-coil domain-containing protein 189 [Fundulus heteroclitus]XP_021172484.2 coiled-coil domain-containing protein 189 [Fundulus heteroclitus]
MDTTIMVPRDFTAKLLLWKDISYHDMELIDQMQTIPDLERTLCSVLGVDLPEPKKGVLLELYVQTVLFCREQNFNKEQTSALLSIIKSIHEANVETPLNNSEQCLRYCNDLLLCHSVRRPPFSINLFSFQEANCILNHIQDHYLRHYRIYKYIFTPQVKLDLFLTYSGTAEQGPSAADDSSVSAGVINMRGEEADTKRSDSSETQETTTTEEEEASDGSTDLKALIEREVGQQMQQVSRLLDERIRGTASEQNSRIHDAKPNQKGKK